MSSHASATLPQELIDLLVEQLGLKRDTKSLIACLTVSKAFLSMARVCLWRDRFLGPYRTSQLGCVKWSLDNIPKCSVLPPLVRSMRLNMWNWSLENTETLSQDLSTVVDAFERVNRVEFEACFLFTRILTLPVFSKWHIVSLRVPLVVRLLREDDAVPAPFCAFFKNFPSLKNVELDFDMAGVVVSTPLCMSERHRKLPQPVSLTIRRTQYSPDSHYVRNIVAGHLFSLKLLRTVEVNDTTDLDMLLASTSDTVKELVVRPLPSEHDHDQRLFSFHRAESILFTLDTKQEAREMLLWWTRVVVHNHSNDTVQKVTIEIQLHLDPKRRSPKICFPEVWTEFGTALGGLLALGELVIIYQPGGRDRIGNADDAATRARVTKFLRGKLGAIGGSTRVGLAFIDRNI